MDSGERLREELLDLERAFRREREMRLDAEALAAALQAVQDATSPDSMLAALVGAIRPAIPASMACLLVEVEPGRLVAMGASSPQLSHAVWPGEALFERVLSGAPSAVFDVLQVPEWQAQPAAVRDGVGSALHIALLGAARPGMLVCTHPDRGGFSRRHLQLSTKLGAVASQILLRMDLQDAVRQRDKFFTLALDMMCILSEDGFCSQMNGAWQLTLGYTAPELRRRPLLDFVHEADRPGVLRTVAQVKANGGKAAFEARMLGKGGFARVMRWNVASTPGDRLLYVTAQDITDLTEAHAALEQRTRELQDLAERLEEAALEDSLTGLRNRRYVQARIDQDLAAARRARRGHLGSRPESRDANIDLGLLLADIDYFKRVNDEHGHEAGDRVLVEFARRLVTCVREVDIVARWGGEEFLLLLPQTNHVHLQSVAGRIRAAVGGHPFSIGANNTVDLSCSIGFCHYPLGPSWQVGWNDLLRIVDTALYLAKGGGRDKYVGFDTGERVAEAPPATDALADLTAAVERGWLRLVSAKSGATRRRT